MPQNIITAGNATSAFSQAAGDDGTFKIVVGPNGSQVDALAFSAAGVPTLAKTPNVTTAQSMVRLNTANGYGSTNNKIRRFTNVVTNQGSDITYADSATMGASFTINTAGVYSISYSDQFTSAGIGGLSLNTATPTTAIWSCAVGEILALSATPSAGQPNCAAWVGYLPAGAVVRPHTDGSVTGTTPNAVQFTITRVA